MAPPRAESPERQRRRSAGAVYPAKPHNSFVREKHAKPKDKQHTAESPAKNSKGIPTGDVMPSTTSFFSRSARGGNDEMRRLKDCKAPPVANSLLGSF
ncbi:unnamed protein product [Nippostrongylus brasiliensis]|uniref:PCNA-clamp-associated factor n=1 Tax=Nippostrongylus brasiliensis TaxID=27835 RepID=A0A0N4Y3V2_NIPBR|nr:unnamed protein product [Nippostrongylus brasiliensis]